jgi:cytochrome c biogenesis factor
VSFDAEGRAVTFRFHLNPGVTLLWVGGAIMLLGGLIAAWPSRSRPPLGRPEVPSHERVEAVT